MVIGFRGGVMIDRPAEDAVTPTGPVRWDVGDNYHACEGKQTCIEVCPTDVFDMQKTSVKHPLFRLKIIVRGGRDKGVRHDTG